MIAITVQREPADKQGPDITDPLLTAENAALERGRNEIDHNSTARIIESITGPYRRFVAPGSLAKFHGRRGYWKGMVTRCAITLNRNAETFTAECALEMEREQ